MLDKLFEKRSTVNNNVQTLEQIFNSANKEKYIGTDAAAKISTVFACISIRANAMAKLPIHVYKKGDQGKDKIDNHINYLLKTRPNPLMSAFKFKQTISVLLDLYGNSFVWIETKKGRPINLWVLDGNTTLHRVNNKYWVITTLNDKTYKLKYEEVLHFSDIALDGIIGISKTDVAREILSNIQNSYKLMGDYYNNGSIAKGILSTASTLDKEAKNIIKNAWANSNGNMAVGGVAVVDGGMEFKPISSTFADYQFTDLAKLTKQDIAMIYNVPIHMLNDLDKATFSNIENLNLQFFQGTIQPLITMIEDEMNYKLFTETERQQNYFVKFNTNAMLRGDTAARTNFYKEMLNQGAANLDEVREWEDMNPIPNGQGKEHYRSLNYVPLSIANDYQLSKAGADNTNSNKGDDKDK